MPKLRNNDVSVYFPTNILTCPNELNNVVIKVNKNLKNDIYIINFIATRKSDNLQRNSTFKLKLLPKEPHPPYLEDLTSNTSANYTSPTGFPVNWAVKAKDDENDKIYYRYYLLYFPTFS